MIIQKTKEYLPYAFLKRGNKQFKYLKIESERDFYPSYRNADKIFNIDEFLSTEKVGKVKTNKYTSLQFTIGNGIIYSDYRSKLFAVLCVNNKTKEQIILVNKNEYINDLNRFKRFINKNGFSSRKQLIEVDNLNDMFLVDLLKPDMEDYSSEVQEKLSGEFLTKMKLEYAEE